MKCEKCNNDSVKIKGKHYCPSCGNKIKPTIIKSVAAKPLLKKETVSISHDEAKISVSEATAPEVKLSNANLNNVSKAENQSAKIRDLIKENTEPNGLEKHTIASEPKKLDMIGNVHEGKVKRVNYMESIFAKDDESDTKESHLKAIKELGRYIPTKKEKLLKITLIVVIILNILFVGGIVYMVVNQ